MNKIIIPVLCIIYFISGCASTNFPKAQKIQPVYGNALRQISNDQNLVAEAITASEAYWNAQKNSDSGLFRSVTPHESMYVVFDWLFNNSSDIIIESAPIIGIQNNLMKFNEHYSKYAALQHHAADKSIREIEIASLYADSIEKGGYPMLGNLLKKGHWNAVIPLTIANYTNYKLMNIRYIADVNTQSRRGVPLKKRVTLNLYRMQADSYDSGWKVLFLTGM